MLTQTIETMEKWDEINTLHEPEHNRKELDESIRYAKRIQDGMMLKEKHFQRLFPESFLYLRPRNIVSGDFYWFTKINHKIIVAAADCTGHGIPGALMSILGIGLLNQIVIEEKNTDPSFILQRLDHKVHKAFSYTQDMLEEQEKNIQNDGMDISLVCIDTRSKILQFSGAYSPMYLVRNQTLTEVRGSRYPIGGINIGNEKLFQTNYLEIEENDRIYLCSDGFASQFGYFTNKKFSSKRLKEILVQNSEEPMDKQKNELERNFVAWKVSTEQTDDVMVMGFKI